MPCPRHVGHYVIPVGDDTDAAIALECGCVGAEPSCEPCSAAPGGCPSPGLAVGCAGAVAEGEQAIHHDVGDDVLGLALAGTPRSVRTDRASPRNRPHVVGIARAAVDDGRLPFLDPADHPSPVMLPLSGSTGSRVACTVASAAGATGHRGARRRRVVTALPGYDRSRQSGCGCRRAPRCPRGMASGKVARSRRRRGPAVSGSGAAGAR